MRTNRVDIDQAIQMVISGMTYNEVADEFGCSPNYIGWIWSHKATPEHKAQRKRDTTEKIDEGKIMALFKAGWCVMDIADDMNLEPEIVKRSLIAIYHRSRREDG